MVNLHELNQKRRSKDAAPQSFLISFLQGDDFEITDFDEYKIQKI
jgi:hypothetical protein